MSTAPDPSPAEQAVIDRFGIFRPEILIRLDIGAVLAAWCDLDRDLADEYAEILLPIVDRIAKERAADEMRAVAHRLDDGGDEAVEVALGGAVYVHRVLCDTAHALDGRP